MTCIVCQTVISAEPVETMDNSGKLVMRVTCRYCGANNSEQYEPGLNLSAVSDPLHAVKAAAARDAAVKRSLKAKR